jgi:hypothetical protein
VLVEVAVALTSGAAAVAWSWLVDINVPSLSDAGGACVLAEGSGGVSPRDSGLGGVVGSGWAHATEHMSISISERAKILFILQPHEFF